MPARFDLQDVFKIIDSGDRDKIQIGYQRGTKLVIEAYRNSTTPMENREADDFILAGVRSLTPDNFCKSVLHKNDSSVIMDEYGLIYDDKPWYVKLYLDGDFLFQLSFHPPQREMKLENGTKIPKGESDD